MTMRKALIIAFLAMGGCGDTWYVDKVEDGEVVQTIYLPGQSGSVTGFTTGGHVVFGDSSTEDTWAVVFRCQHGQFAIKGDDDRAHDLWKKLRVGPVKIRYQEEYSGDRREPSKAVLRRLRFVDAELPSKP